MNDHHPPMDFSAQLADKRKERQIEDQVIAAYVRRRGVTHPGYTPNMKKTGSDWAKIAELVNSIDADPAAFIDAQFDHASGRAQSGFPFPAQLHSEAAVSIYREYAERNAPAPESSFDAQMLLLNCQFEVVTMQAIDTALSYPQLGFRSWFRILMCSDEKLHLFQQIWGEAARKQVRQNIKLKHFLEVHYHARTVRFI